MYFKTDSFLCMYVDYMSICMCVYTNVCVQMPDEEFFEGI